VILSQLDDSTLYLTPAGSPLILSRADCLKTCGATEKCGFITYLAPAIPVLVEGIFRDTHCFTGGQKAK
jgi:hypothetical protein